MDSLSQIGCFLLQGAELVVLQGATQLLQQVSFVQFEASMVEYNSGGACWSDVDALLQKHGFYFYDFGDANYGAASTFHTKGIGQVDILYIRPGSSRLPAFYKDTQFCGMSRPSSQQQQSLPQVALVQDQQVRQVQQSLLYADTMTTRTTAENIDWFKWYKWLVSLFAAFLLGYTTARFLLLRKPQRRSV
jgi:hypothetical protein